MNLITKDVIHRFYILTGRDATERTLASSTCAPTLAPNLPNGHRRDCGRFDETTTSSTGENHGSSGMLRLCRLREQKSMIQEAELNTQRQIESSIRAGCSR